MTLPHRIVSLAMLAALSVSGCGHSPTAPATSSTLSPAPGGDASAIGRIAPDEPAPVAIEGSATIKGKDGGSLTVGAFTLQVPAGAYSGNATITLRQADPRLMQVEIDVQPASKNTFANTATLTADLSAWSSSQVRRARMWFMNSATGEFEVVAGATVDLARRQVRGQFLRLSTSKVR